MNSIILLAVVVGLAGVASADSLKGQSFVQSEAFKGQLPQVAPIKSIQQSVSYEPIKSMQVQQTDSFVKGAMPVKGQYVEARPFLQQTQTVKGVQQIESSFKGQHLQEPIRLQESIRLQEPIRLQESIRLQEPIRTWAPQQTEVFKGQLPHETYTTYQAPLTTYYHQAMPLRSFVNYAPLRSYYSAPLRYETVKGVQAPMYQEPIKAMQQSVQQSSLQKSL